MTDRWQVFSDFVLTRESLAELAQSADELLVHGASLLPPPPPPEHSHISTGSVGEGGAHEPSRSTLAAAVHLSTVHVPSPFLVLTFRV